MFHTHTHRALFPPEQDTTGDCLDREIVLPGISPHRGNSSLPGKQFPTGEMFPSEMFLSKDGYPPKIIPSSDHFPHYTSNCNRYESGFLLADILCRLKVSGNRVLKVSPHKIFCYISESHSFINSLHSAWPFVIVRLVSTKRPLAMSTVKRRHIFLGYGVMNCCGLATPT